ncbi:hypothetical protein ASPACDRAFT_64276 [Aspergillus aculeatus ATCC 16872]|uniref:MACPF domain-containing protein n=1 Tax=Aspergillus aculeatus (strain ATCC 16872 / CBS 172.66 / WB 5094) TaxID=690307 RepID=A0A1L9WI27_ASPA1|nr:uncharacterized protein ASPACDRAFT_64276 [Aspergillus aculeatus ATCC 16872]OJJ95806.1 hypothetical protein ASPACDRAFT_64276 [Aspergillus aculeatus ATCC 16872]
MSDIGISDGQQWRVSAPFDLVDGLDDWLKRLSQMAKDISDGDAFPSKVILGGFLRSSRDVKVKTTEQLDAAKEETRRAAEVSFAAPQVSFGVTYASTTSETKTSGQGQTVGNAALTWEARGGDTVLCSNPSAWAATVKDYRNRGITEQSQTVSLVSVIDGIDPNMGQKVEYPNQEHGNTPDNTKLTERELIDTHR